MNYHVRLGHLARPQIILSSHSETCHTLLAITPQRNFSFPLKLMQLSSLTMEPISLAFEITSLSMQLVAMVKTIKGLVTAYKSAAQELEKLCVELDDIETTCDCLGAALSQANSSTPAPELLPLLSRLKGCIQDCYDKVSKGQPGHREDFCEARVKSQPFQNYWRFVPAVQTSDCNVCR